MNIPSYVEPVIEKESITVEEALKNPRKSLDAACEGEDRLNKLLKQNGLLP